MMKHGALKLFLEKDLGFLPYLFYLISQKHRSIYTEYFHARYYLRAQQDQNLVSVDFKKALKSYLTVGYKNKQNPSPYFDVEWYLNQLGPEPLNSDPLVHYVITGWQKGLSPNRYFDTAWYLNQNPDVKASKMEPMWHFLKYGQFEGRRAHPDFVNECFFGSNTQVSDLEPRQPQNELSIDWGLSVAPLVSVIVANYNGLHHLPALFESIDQQTYRNFEVIFVDDTSSDGSVSFAKDKGARVVELGRRSGFARANNAGLSSARGELIALLNNDMRVDPNWLESMVATLKENSNIGAVAPRILFWTKFQRLEIRSNRPFRLVEDSLLEGLEYKKYFVRLADHSVTGILGVNIGSSWAITIDLPIQLSAYKFTFMSAHDFVMNINCGPRHGRYRVARGISTVEFALSEFEAKGGFFVINNAGSQVGADGQPADRGFGEVESRQYYSRCEVQFICGGAALIRRDALLGKPLFIDDFVAYYEDSELSTRLTGKGFSIIFDPNAIVYHKHSATNVEKSSFWLKQTFRNRFLFRYVISNQTHRSQLAAELDEIIAAETHAYLCATSLTHDEATFFSELPQIAADIRRVTRAIDTQELPFKASLRVGVYNPFWSTFGGGEAHALTFAMALSRYGQVELISESDFDLDELYRFFGFDAFNARIRIVKRMTPEISGEYDIFVNSAFQNEMLSRAAKSYFIMNFPSQTPSDAFLASYEFIANSNYTLDWAKKRWGADRFRGRVIYPAISGEIRKKSGEDHGKGKLILSVGRFASNGHTKSQKEIVQAFLDAAALPGQSMEGWKLLLIGSCNDYNYLAEVQELSSQGNIEIQVDAAFETVVEAYQGASIYVHASGLGRDASTEPERLEHFGIAVAEAMGAGCLPIVYAAGGPKEIVQLFGIGLTFSTTAELVAELLKAVALMTAGGLGELHKLSIEASARFSRERIQEEISILIGQSREAE